jgi:hypothetical protein
VKQSLAEMWGKVQYIRPKVVGPCASESYMHGLPFNAPQALKKVHCTMFTLHEETRSYMLTNLVLS